MERCPECQSTEVELVTHQMFPDEPVSGCYDCKQCDYSGPIAEGESKEDVKRLLDSIEA